MLTFLYTIMAVELLIHTQQGRGFIREQLKVVMVTLHVSVDGLLLGEAHEAHVFFIKHTATNHTQKCF